MAHVFLSYSRHDIDAAKRLARALEQSGLSVWWDRTIPPGKTFDQVIEAALDEATWAVVLWSSASIASNWVKSEAEEALRRGMLVPVLIEDVRPPLAFRRIEAAELQDWDGDTGHHELHQLLEVLGGKAPPPRPEPPPKPAPKPPPKPQPAPPPLRPQPAPAPVSTPAAPTRTGMATRTKLALGCGALAVLAVAAAIVVAIVANRAAAIDPYPPADDHFDPKTALPPNTGVVDDPKAGVSSGKGTKSIETRPIVPSTGDITLRYAGDAMACSLNLQIGVGDRTIVPQSNLFNVNGLRLGAAPYSISGLIGCPGVGTCEAEGYGTLDVVDGALYDIIWLNDTYAHCSVSLQRTQ